MSNKNNHLKKIKITNFRGLRDMSLDNLGLVNVLVGGNNVGKTTVLEAIFLLCGMGRPDFFVYVPGLIRSLKVNSMEDLKYFSHTLDFNAETKIKCLLTGNADITISMKNNSSGQFSASPRTKELLIKSKHQKKEKTKEFAVILSNSTDPNLGISLRQATNEAQNDKDEIEKLIIELIYVKNNGDIGKNDLDNVFRYKLDTKLIEYLKHFDSRIVGIKLIGEKLYMDTGMPEMLPVNLMGDGFIHNISILATMIRSDIKIVLLDQIEDGLHHTAPEPLLKAILELAQKENKQIFITTHSIEMLQKFKTVLDEQKDMQDKFCLYALQRDKKGDVKSYRFRYSQFEAGIRNNWEVR